MAHPIAKCALPNDALLAEYQRDGYYADCYSTLAQGCVTHPDYVVAFYTTRLFKLERALLKWCVAKPSTDDEARQLANGTRHDFAAWTVERKTDNQLLVRDFRGRTRSWLMTVPERVDDIAVTRLYFGSAVVPQCKYKSKKPSLGLTFYSLIGFHKIYSVALLYSARRRLMRSNAKGE